MFTYRYRQVAHSSTQKMGISTYQGFASAAQASKTHARGCLGVCKGVCNSRKMVSKPEFSYARSCLPGIARSVKANHSFNVASAILIAMTVPAFRS